MCKGQFIVKLLLAALGIGAVAAALVTAASPGQVAPQALQAAQVTKERLCGLPPEDCQRLTSPDGWHVAWVHWHPDRDVVVVDGKEVPGYDKVATMEEAGYCLRFSPDSQHVAFMALRGGKCLVVVDGKAGAQYDDASPERLTFSPDSRHVAYPAFRGHRAFAVVDGREGPPAYDYLVRGPLFSPDSQRVAFMAVRREKSLVVVDGKEGPEYDQASPESLVFSPDSRHLAYLAAEEANWWVVVDGREERVVQMLTDRAPVFRPDGRRVACVVERGEGQSVAVVGGPGGPEYGPVYRELDPSSLVFSPDSRHFAYIACHDERWLATVAAHQRGEWGPENTKGGDDTQVVEENPPRVVVLDGREGPPYPWVEGLVFSPDSRHLAYVAHRDDSQFVVMDGREGPAYDFVAPGRPIFSPDGQRTAYVAGRGGKSLVVVDGREGPKYKDAEFPVFSPDSRHIAYAAQRGDRWRVVVDGREGPEVPDIAYGGEPQFAADGSVRYLVQSADGFYRVTQR
jgi:Tol biopolymer transport system component